MNINPIAKGIQFVKRLERLAQRIVIVVVIDVRRCIPFVFILSSNDSLGKEKRRRRRKEGGKEGEFLCFFFFFVLFLFYYITGILFRCILIVWGISFSFFFVACALFEKQMMALFKLMLCTLIKCF